MGPDKIKLEYVNVVLKDWEIHPWTKEGNQLKTKDNLLAGSPK
jgi:hypothetical protein